MAERRYGSDSDEEDRHLPDDAYYAYGSPVQSRLEKQYSRKARREKGDSRRSSGHRKKSGHVTGRLSPANASSGSEDRRAAEKWAADGETRTAQRKKDRYDKLTLFDEHADGNVNVGMQGDGADGKGMYSSFSELSVSSEGSFTPSPKAPLSTRLQTESSIRTSSSAATPVTVEPVPRHSLHQYACRIVRGLELVESARFYVKQALSISAEGSAEADQKAAALSLWTELQAALQDRGVREHESVLMLTRGHIDKLMCEIEQFRWSSERSSSTYTAEPFGLSRTFAKAFSSSFQDDNRKRMEVVEDLDCFPIEYRVALQTVNQLLSLFEQACALYPSQAELFECERQESHEEFDHRLATLLAWSNGTWQLASTLATLRKWLHVDVSVIILESVDPDYASDIVLGALSNPAISNVTLEPVQEHTAEEEGVDGFMPSRSMPAKGSDDTLDPHQHHDVNRSKSDSSSQRRLGVDKQKGLHTQRYSPFVDASLKRLGLTALLKRLISMSDTVVRRVHSMFLCPEEQEEFRVDIPRFADSSILLPPSSEGQSAVSRALSYVSLSPSTATSATMFARQQSGTSSVSGSSQSAFPLCSWEDEFDGIGLPSLAEPYLALLRVPVDVIQEVIRLWLEQQPGWKPSTISIHQLLLESKELLVAAYEIKMYYVQLLQGALPYLSTLFQRQLEVSQVSFEQDLKKVLETYLGLLHSYILKTARVVHTDLDPVHVLEEEWRFMRRLVPHVRQGMSHVGRRFCIMAQGFVENLCNLLEAGLDACTRELHDLDRSMDLRAELLKAGRSFRKLFQQVRDRSTKAVGFSRMLRKEMQIAADFARLPSCDESMLLTRLRETGHALVHVTNFTCRTMFVSPSLEGCTDHVMKLLDIACGRAETERWPVEGYLVLISQSSSPAGSQPNSATNSISSNTTLTNVPFSGPSTAESGPSKVSSVDSVDQVVTGNQLNPANLMWTGCVVEVEPPKETALALGELPVEDVKIVVSQASSLSSCRQMFNHLVKDILEVTLETTSTYHDVGESLADLTADTIQLGSRLMKAVDGVGKHLLEDGICELEQGASDKRLIVGYVKTMQRCYGTAFEFLDEVERLLAGDQCRSFGIELADFVFGWMKYVSVFCDMSLHSQPRWMAQGLKFVTLACQQNFTMGLTEEEYHAFSVEVTEFLDNFQYGNPGDSSPQTDEHESPWQSMDQDDVTGTTRPVATRHWSASSLVRNRSKMNTRRSSSQRVLRWYSSASGGSSPVTHCYPSESRGSSLPIFVRGSYSSVDDSSSADENQSVTVRRFRSTSEPAGIAIRKSGRLSPVVGSPNDAPVVESLPLFQERFLNNLSPVPASLQDESDSIAAGVLVSSTPKRPSDDHDEDDAVREGHLERHSSDFYPSRIRRCQASLAQLDEKRATTMSEKRLVGRVTSPSFQEQGRSSIISLKLKQVRFRWQRGNKIGAGKFGKVYSCVNLDTGTIMAVKEVTFQGSSSGAIKDLADEIKMVENINHPHLVHYYGVETHKEEVLIFMEYCPGGTMHDIAKQGPPESMVRVWANQLLLAVQVLHDNGIVHGDIKGANIFLTQPEGHVKLGDFGSSAKLKDVGGTAHGELVGMRGTVAYMAPEVITQNQGRGFGRPADIWSVGCVVVELMTGKHPWSECDNEFSIMYRVGDGKPPTIPDTISKEGTVFMEKCFIVNPSDRPTASKLLEDIFVRTHSSGSL